MRRRIGLLLFVAARAAPWATLAAAGLFMLMPALRHCACRAGTRNYRTVHIINVYHRTEHSSVSGGIAGATYKIDLQRRCVEQVFV